MEDHYFNFLLNNPKIPPLGMVTMFLLGLGRIIPLVIIPPFFGNKNIPAPARIGLALSLVAIIMPKLILTSTITIESVNWTFIALFLKEVFIGFLLAFLVTLPFYIAQSSGIIVDFMRGSSSMIGQDPTMKNQTSIFGILFNQITILIFFLIGGPYLFINSLFLSYSILPQDAFISPLFFTPNYPLWQQMFSLAAHVLAVAIQLAAPAIVGCLMAEVFLGIANRLAPQVQIAFLGMSIKSLLGIALLWLGWFYILKQISVESLKWLDTIHKLVYMLNPQ